MLYYVYIKMPVTKTVDKIIRLRRVGRSGSLGVALYREVVVKLCLSMTKIRY